MLESYEPFSYFFLLPSSLKTRITPLSKLLTDEEFFKGNFSLKKPDSVQAFKTELKKMKICSESQTNFIKKIHLKKRLKQIQADDEMNKIRYRKSGRGRPMKKKNFNKKYLKKLGQLSKEIQNFDQDLALEKVNNESVKNIYEDSPQSSSLTDKNLEFDLEKFLSYKRKKLKIEGDEETPPRVHNGIQVSSVGVNFSEESNRKMIDVSTTNVCEMIDFGNEIPSICSSQDLLNSFELNRSRASSIVGIEKFIMNDACIQTSRGFEAENKFTQVDF